MLCAVATVFCSWGAERSEAEARNAAANFLKSSQALMPLAKGQQSTEPVLTLVKSYNKLDNRVKSLYVYNIDTDGFMLVSADDALTPVLGYSRQGSFNPDSIPPGLQWFIDETSKNTVSADAAAVALNSTGQRRAVGPLLTTKWNQSYPYNIQCPQYTIPGYQWDGEKYVDYTDNAPTGCGATALAQVMNYFKWPKQPHGTISYNMLLEQPADYWNIDQKIMTDYGLAGVMEMDLDNITFDWDNMLDDYVEEYSTEAQKNAVATLMKAAGYSISMGYGKWESWSYASDLLPALTNYFGYRNDGQFFYKNNHTHKEIEELVYAELEAGAPILWRGGNPSGAGHLFVCDGYDGNGYYHFNWGWGGYCDGYFSLMSLVPTGAGIGGSIDGYDYDQYMLLGIRPDNDEWQPTEVKPDLEANWIGEYNNMYVVYYTVTTGFLMDTDVQYFFGLEVTKPNGDKSDVPFYGPFSYPAGYNYYIDQIGYEKNQISLMTADYPDGVYELRPNYWIDGGQSKPIFHGPNSFDCIVMTRESGVDTFEIRYDSNPYNINVNSVKVRGGDIISGIPSSIRIEVANNGNEPVYDYIRVYFYHNSVNGDYYDDIYYKVVPLAVLPGDVTTVEIEECFTVLSLQDIENGEPNDSYDNILLEGKHDLQISGPGSVLIYDSPQSITATCFNPDNIEEVDGIAYMKGSAGAHVMPASYSSSTATNAEGRQIYVGDITINPTVTFADGTELPVYCSADYLRYATNLKLNATESWIEGEWAAMNYPMESLWIDNMTNIPMDAFPYLQNLKSLTIGKGVKTVGSYAFFGCESLEKIDMAEIESLGMYAFAFCHSAKEIIISPNINKIPLAAIYGNDADVIVIPANVRSIDNRNLCRNPASANLAEPQVIFIENENEVIADIDLAFYDMNTNKYEDAARIYVPAHFHADYDDIIGYHDNYELYATIEGFEDSDYTLNEGETVVHQPVITSGAENTDPVYAALSSNDEVAAVDPETMTITAVKAGSAQIEFTSRQHSDLKHIAAVTVLSTDAIEEVALDENALKFNRVEDTVEIYNAPVGSRYDVFDTAGRRLDSGVVTSGLTKIKVGAQRTPVIVKIGTEAYKLM